MNDHKLRLEEADGVICAYIAIQFVSNLCKLIIQKIGPKETLKYHHLHNLKRSRLQFELWWLKGWITGRWPC